MATTRDGKSDMVLDIQGDWVNWAVYDDEGLVERGNFMLGTATVEGALYRADRLLAEFDENPAIPAKSPGYDPGYTETFPSSFPAPDFMEPGRYAVYDGVNNGEAFDANWGERLLDP